MSGSGRETEGFIPDRIIHEPTRLQIISYLAVSGKQVSFTELREKLSLSAGNLSVQLKKLEEAGYVSIVKSFRERKPLTRVSLTRQGLEALQQYLGELEKMIDRLKNTTPPAGMD
ncbi:MAG: transcriptional regulator [Candidatus Desulforudis sp.]|nr:transcriptional regulator [Desulforudis sp.]